MEQEGIDTAAHLLLSNYKQGSQLFTVPYCCLQLSTKTTYSMCSIK